MTVIIGQALSNFKAEEKIEEMKEKKKKKKGKK